MIFSHRKPTCTHSNSKVELCQSSYLRLEQIESNCIMLDTLDSINPREILHWNVIFLLDVLQSRKKVITIEFLNGYSLWHATVLSIQKMELTMKKSAVVSNIFSRNSGKIGSTSNHICVMILSDRWINKRKRCNRHTQSKYM